MATRTFARPQNVVVVNGKCDPCIGPMAGIAAIGAQNMTSWLSARHHAVVAGRATPCHLSVIDRLGRRPKRHGMTVFA